MQLTFTSRKVIFFLGATIGLLVVAHLAGMIAFYYYNHTSSFYIIEYFRLAADTNLPTFFSSAQLLLCAALLALIANLRKKQGASDYRQWLGLSAIMLFLSIDEATMIHEMISDRISERFNTSGIFIFAWVIPYSIFAIAVAVIYLPFLFKLPIAVRNRMMLAGFIFVSGALGLEFIENYYFSVTGNLKDFTLALFTTAEEIMEMCGILLFLYSLLYYIEHEFEGASIQLTSKTSEAPASGKEVIA